MTDSNLFIAAILGLVEGVTEFLPVSSTGHLIVAGSLLDYTGEKAKLFEIVIQAGAVLAVCWEYRAKLLAVAAGIFSERSAQRFVLNLLIAFLPAALLGLVFGSAIKANCARRFLWPPRSSPARSYLLVMAHETQARRGAYDRSKTARPARSKSVRAGFAIIHGTSRSGATIRAGCLRPVAHRGDDFCSSCITTLSRDRLRIRQEPPSARR